LHYTPFDDGWVRLFDSNDARPVSVTPRSAWRTFETIPSVTSDPWPAPRPRAPLDAVVSVPGSKSMTNRALVLAALAATPTL